MSLEEITLNSLTLLARVQCITLKLGCSNLRITSCMIHDAYPLIIDSLRPSVVDLEKFIAIME